MLKSLKWYKSLHKLKGRIESGCFLVEGPKAFFQIYNTFPHTIKEIIVDENFQSTKQIQGNIRTLDTKQFKSISLLQNNQGVLGVIYLPEHCYEDIVPQHKGSKILILEGIQDPGNIGNLIRSAAAFNFNGVLLDHDCADPFSPKAVQASSGSILNLWIRRISNLITAIHTLKESGYTIIATDLQGESDTSCFKNRNIALVLGSEGQGISGNVLGESSTIFHINQSRKAVESLNVASTGAICMFLVHTLHS